MPPKKKQEEPLEEQAPDTQAVGGEVGILDLSAEEIASAQGYHIVESGTYEIELAGIIFSYSKNLNPMCTASICIVIEDDPLVSQIRHRVMLPTTRMDKRMREGRNFDLKCFTEGFGISHTELVEVAQAAFSSLVPGDLAQIVQIDDYNGLRGGAIIKVEESEGYPDKNKISKFVSL